MAWYGHRQNLASRLPPELTAPNGMNFTRSVGKSTSNLERVRTYLRTNGPRRMQDILRDVFGKTIVPTGHWAGPDMVGRGWNSYMFALAVKHGYLRKERKGNAVWWSAA